jgi:hypothetical protein
MGRPNRIEHWAKREPTEWDERQQIASFGAILSEYAKWILRLEDENARLRGSLDAISLDMHQTSTRPCPTCKSISDTLGEPFGCRRYRREKEGEE